MDKLEAARKLMEAFPKLAGKMTVEQVAERLEAFRAAQQEKGAAGAGDGPRPRLTTRQGSLAEWVFGKDAG